MTGRPACPAAAGAVVAMAAAWASHAQTGLSGPGGGLGLIDCSVTADAPLVRLGGTLERVADVTLTCHNVGPAVRSEPTGILDAAVSLTFTAGVASRDGVASLSVNESVCPSANEGQGTGDGCDSDGAASVAGARDLLDPRRLVWDRFEFPIPGAAITGDGEPRAPPLGCGEVAGDTSGCHPEVTTVRLGNLRLRVADLGSPESLGGGQYPIWATVSMRLEGAVHALSETTVRVATAVPGVSLHVATPQLGRLCSAGETTANVTLGEGFAGAFQPAGDDGLPSLRSGDPLGATRLLVRMAGIPPGVSVQAPTAPECGPEGGSRLRLGLVEGAAESGHGGTLAPAQLAELALEGPGSVLQAVYEVLGADPSVQQECSIPFRLRTEGLDAAGGGVSVSASFGPLETPGSADIPADASRFAAMALASPVQVRMAPCGTSLLFPFVTSQTTFDTAVVIVNTSSDPLGTRHQAGRCSLEFHSAEGPGPGTLLRSVRVGAGKQVSFRLSSGNQREGLDPLPDFQGYLLARCAFQHAQGYAFITEQIGGASVLAQGYLAEVVTGL